MKRAAVLSLVALAAAASVQAQTFNDRARVRSVEPQYESVSVPRQQCTSQWINETRPVAADPRHFGGVALGGLIGGVAGHQIGKGHGQDAATAVGAVVGALVGQQIAARHAYPQQVQVQQREVQRCHTVSEVQTRLTGYRVDYEYQGQTYTTVMQEEPGRFIPVQVSVVPLQREYHRR